MKKLWPIIVKYPVQFLWYELRLNGWMCSSILACAHRHLYVSHSFIHSLIYDEVEANNAVRKPEVLMATECDAQCSRRDASTRSSTLYWINAKDFAATQIHFLLLFSFSFFAFLLNSAVCVWRIEIFSVLYANHIICAWLQLKGKTVLLLICFKENFLLRFYCYAATSNCHRYHVNLRAQTHPTHNLNIQDK